MLQLLQQARPQVIIKMWDLIEVLENYTCVPFLI